MFALKMSFIGVRSHVLHYFFVRKQRENDYSRYHSMKREQYTLTICVCAHPQPHKTQEDENSTVTDNEKKFLRTQKQL